MSVFIIACLVVAADQIGKYVISHSMILNQSVPVIPGFFHITYILNKGAAFGFLEHKQWLFIAVAIGLFLLYFTFRKHLPKVPVVTVGTGLLFAGPVGHAVERCIF